jgi:hypothetical protein
MANGFSSNFQGKRFALWGLAVFGDWAVVMRSQGPGGALCKNGRTETLG